MGNDLRRQLEDLQKENSRLKSALKSSYIDKLSGLWNRNFFDMFKRKYENSDSVFGIIYVDANGLKSINDEYGHKEGDKYIAEIGKLLKETLKRKSDFAFRIGGDEFLMVLAPTGENPRIALDILTNRLKINLREANKEITKTGQRKLSLAIGTTIKESVEKFSAALERADKLMYENKKLQKSQDQ